MIKLLSRTLLAATISATTLTLVASTVASAQSSEPRKSQAASVSQTVNKTVISLRYIRPVARGRELFGDIVKWDKIWTPGADSATTITISTPVQINGSKLEAGTYSIWAKPGQSKWTVIFNKAQPVFHIPYSYADQEVLTIEAVPREGAHMETLAFYFPVVDGKKAELVLHWGKTVVPFAIEVP